MCVTFHNCEGGEALEQDAQGSCGCRSAQGLVGWHSEQSGPLEGVPAHGSVIGTR